MPPEPPSSTNPARVMSIPRARPSLRDLGIAGLIAVGLLVGLYAAHGGLADAQALLASVREQAGPGTLIVLALVYAATLAVPFVPGMELGLLIMVVYGPVGVAVAYVATLLGLSLSYATGRLLPVHRIPWGSKLRHAATPGHDLKGALPAMLSVGRWGRHLSPRFVAWLGAHRYVALAICLNVPGNAVMGGGGGLALLCGLSRQFEGRWFALTIALAVSPLPLLILTGILSLDSGTFSIVCCVKP